MKVKGKWAVLLILMAILVGCSGGGGGGGGSSSSSSDEPLIPGSDNPIRGTWKVTVNPRGEDLTIEPVTLGATGWPVGIVLDEQVSLPGEVEVNLANKRCVAKSAEVYSGAGKTGAKYVGSGPTPDYSFNIQSGKPAVNCTIKRIAAGTIGDGQNVYVNYRYFRCTDCDAMDIGFTVTDANVSYANSVTTADITIENMGPYIIEEIRSITGLVAGAGAANNPTLSNSDYPLAVGDTPDATPADDLVDGWSSGLCYATHGNWTNCFSPAVQGCKTTPHPQLDSPYMVQGLDPVCGKMTDTWEFSGSREQYVFYMQLTGNVYPWIPDWTNTGSARDPRWIQTAAGPGTGAGTSGNSQWFSTYYASLAYLQPNDAYMADPTGECSSDGSGKAFYYGYAGTASLKTGETKRCGTLITDPHLKPGTFFALNVGLEFSDWMETYNQDFWDEYIAIAPASRNPKADLSKGAPYINVYDFQLMWDTAIVETFAAGNYTTPGETYFKGGFVRPYTAGAAGDGPDVGVYNQVSLPSRNAKWEVLDAVNAAKGFMFSLQNIKMGAGGAFSFFAAPATDPYRTYLYITNTGICGSAANPLTGLPRFRRSVGTCSLSDAL